MVSLIRKISLGLLALLFVGAGVNHFFNPEFYVSMMPPYIPAPWPMVYISGVFEIAGGIGLLIGRLRPMAGWGLIALLVAVSPVHIHMLINADQFESIPYWGLVLRIPVQLLLMAWVYWTAIVQPD